MRNYKISFNRGTKLDEILFCKTITPVQAIEYCMREFHIEFSQITEVCEVFNLEELKRQNPLKFYTDEEYDKEFS